MSGTDDPSQVYWSQRNAREQAMSETPQETAQAWCEKHAEHKSVPGTKFVSGRLLCSRDDVVQLLQPLVAERDALGREVAVWRAKEEHQHSCEVKSRDRAEKAEAALRHWQTRESAMNCDACACLGLAIPDELRDTAPEGKP